MWFKMQGSFKRTASKHIYYLWWNRSPAQVGCMRQVFGPGALGRPREIRWRGRWEGGSGWGIHVNPWLIHVNVWQKPLQYCKVISLQLIKKKKKKVKMQGSGQPEIQTCGRDWQTECCFSGWHTGRHDGWLQAGAVCLCPRGIGSLE